jgi:hypothetical protein
MSPQPVPRLYAGLLEDLRALPAGPAGHAAALALAATALREMAIVCEQNRWPALADGVGQIARECRRIAAATPGRAA